MSNPQGAPFLGVSFVSFAALGSSSKVFKTSYALNGIGQLTGALVRDGLPKDVAYTLDGLGQIVRRKEVRTTGNNTGLGPNELFYRFAGKQMGMVGNNGTVDVGYVQSVADRSRGTPDPTAWTAGIFRNGTNTGSSFYADFSQSLDPYNAGQQGSAGGGTYTVRQGDTLQAIAASLYGDGNLWYRIAEANGLSAGAALSEGQSLILPAGVTKSSHNASTFQPYDASEALGDTLPTTPKPPKTPKCGAFGQILSTLVAIAASQFLGPLFGNLVSQGFNMVIGIQSKFSWKSLGMSVVAAVVTGGMSGAFEGIKSAFLQGALQQATTSALTQGIGVATGLQKKFDFAGVAAAGVAGGVMSWVGARLGGRTPSVNAQDKTVWRNGDLSKTGAFLANSAGAIAEAATLSAIKGNSFGDNLLASLPSVIGRAALDGAGAKSILGDGWLGTALADPGSVLGLERGWITKAANSAISTVGNVVADMVRGNAQGGGGGAIGTYASMRFAGSPFDPTNLGMVSHAVHYGREFYHPGTGGKVQSIWGDHSGDIRELTEVTDARWEPLPSKTREIFERERAEYFEKLENIPVPEITPNEAPPEDWIVVTGAKVRRDTPVDASAQRMQAYADSYAAKVDAYDAVNREGSYKRDVLERITLSEAAQESIRSQARGVTNSTFGGFYLGTISAATLPLSLSTGSVLWGGLGTYGAIENASRGANMVFNGRERGILAYGFNEASGTGGENLGVGDYMSFSVDAANLGKASYEVGKLGYGAYKSWRGVNSVTDAAERATARQTLFHYTNEAGASGITGSNSLNPSLWRVGTKDVRYGNGQYLSDIVPGTRTPAQLSRDFLGRPFHGSRFTHYVEIDATGLGSVQGRTGVYVVPNEVPLDLTGRLLNSGKVPGQ